ncbi:hypothetical protein PRIPAC_70244 [Pristionchus pacificus]|uniref:Uncharacterized protein n=1 Tax=Pristionchus pacificus TaxID=54126 RepID=A0A2A6CSM7_PRIPA|nr:hypothetical protein PRIPAC_70244 [Pristionchus pacificus]|eukprot:PDM81224.1 hypothetical protein PRIPAC_36227 [Pristionchus pacificus]
MKVKHRSEWSQHRHLVDAFSFVTFSTACISVNNRTFIPIVVYYACLPYVSSYILFSSLAFLIRRRILLFGHGFSQRTANMQRAFLTMQLLQDLLPLAILSTPFTVFLTGSLLSWNLDIFSIILTLFMWLCPIAQASVQLRFVSQSSSKSPEVTNSMSKTSVIALKRRQSHN